MIVANALAIMLLMALVSMLLVIKRQYHVQKTLIDLQEREQLASLLFINDLSHAVANSIVFDNNKMTFKLHKKYKGRQQQVTESLYVAHHSLFEKINNKRAEALIPFVARFKARYDRLSHQRGINIELKFASEYSQRQWPWFLTVALEGVE